MPVLLLGFYVFLILIRPMDWWAPILGLELVTVSSLMTFFGGLPVILGRAQVVWHDLPQIKAGIAFLFGATLSWLPTFWFTGMQTAFQEVGKLMFFFGLILLLVRTVADYKILLWTFLLCCAWLAVHSILQQTRGVGFGGQPPLWRLRNKETGDFVLQSVAFGTFEDPNDLCSVLIVAVPLFYVLFKTSLNPLAKLLGLIGAPLCGYGAWCTNSRGGVVAAFGMLAGYAIARTKGWRRYIMASVTISLVTFVAPSRFGGGMIGRDRAVLWGDGLAMFRSNPFFGINYGEFTSHSSEHLVCHNSYVHTLAELGLVGYLPFFLMLYLTMVHLRRLMAHRAILSARTNSLLAGVFASLSGYLTALYFISRQYNHILYVILSLSITLVYAVAREAGLTAQVFGQTMKDIKKGLLYGLGSVVIMWVTVRLANLLS